MYQLEYLEVEPKEEYEKIISKVVKTCFQTENLENSKLYVSITLTNDNCIRQINKEHRNIDKSTDVLSFPMFEKEELKEKIENNDFEHEDILGDIVVSLETVEKQAEEYGHGITRELAYMIVHGFYHLMGHDHMVEEEKTIMREKEEKVLSKLEIKR